MRRRCAGRRYCVSELAVGFFGPIKKAAKEHCDLPDAWAARLVDAALDEEQALGLARSLLRDSRPRAAAVAGALRRGVAGCCEPGGSRRRLGVDERVARKELAGFSPNDDAPWRAPPKALCAPPPPPPVAAPAGACDAGRPACPCGKPASTKCGRCRVARYCSAACQRKHWRDHRPRCEKLAAVREERPDAPAWYEPRVDIFLAMAVATATEYPCRGRGAAATRLLGITRRPRRYHFLRCGLANRACARDLSRAARRTALNAWKRTGVTAVTLDAALEVDALGRSLVVALGCEDEGANDGVAVYPYALYAFVDGKASGRLSTDALRTASVELTGLVEALGAEGFRVAGLRVADELEGVAFDLERPA